MALVYMATNLVNSKRYIGYTSRTLEYRKYTHFWFAKTEKYKQHLFGRAIRKYGEEAFCFKSLRDGLTNRDAAILEARLISDLKPEYNIATGLQRASGSKWDQSRREKTIPKMKASWTSERKAVHSARFKGEKKPPHVIEALRAAFDPRRQYKKIICLDDGLVYESVKAAAAYYSLSKKGISDVCCGRGLSVKNKHFAHYFDGFSEAKRLELLANIACKKHHQHVASARVRSRPVICVTDGKRFTSGIAAAKAYGLHASAIMYFCQSGGQSRSGLRFMYADQAAPVEKTPEQKTEILARKRASALRMSKVTSKGVICLEDGSKYASISDAARAINKHVSLLSAAIHRNGKFGGKRFSFLESA